MSSAESIIPTASTSPAPQAEQDGIHFEPLSSTDGKEAAISMAAPAIAPKIAPLPLNHLDSWSTSHARPTRSRSWSTTTLPNWGPSEGSLINLTERLHSKTFQLHSQSLALRGKDREIEQLRYWLDGRGQQAGELFMRIDEEQKGRKGAEGRCEELGKWFKSLEGSYEKACRRVAALEWRVAEWNVEKVGMRVGAGGEETSAGPEERSAADPAEKEGVAPKDGSDGHPSKIDVLPRIASSSTRDLALATTALEAACRHIAHQTPRIDALEKELVETEDELKDLWLASRSHAAQMKAGTRQLEDLEREKEELEHEKQGLEAKIEESEREIERLRACEDKAAARYEQREEAWEVVVEARDAAEELVEKQVVELASLRRRNQRGKKGHEELLVYAEEEHGARVRAEERLAEVLGKGGECGEGGEEMGGLAEKEDGGLGQSPEGHERVIV
ncbi:hypothetical protein B0A55_01655 [Friedmanniomyces simplex]|uniref:Uncharacterized protein n=1 Tax=Friedmanniomyces simplex TaxID=329884 RepID=A0A4U0XTB8_9PEZI|nr:hypothetical protein B0A55_01655 [Friedmanniomyces simplex]